MQLLSSMTRVFSCAPETMANVMYKLLNSCHAPTKGHRAMIEILKWRLHRNVIIILGAEMHQTPFAWWDVHMLKWCSLQSAYYKAECHESLGCYDLPYCLCWICSVAVRLAQHQWSMPIPHLSSLLALCTECRKLQPRWIHAALILRKTVRGYVGNPASYPGGRMISPTYPY